MTTRIYISIVCVLLAMCLDLALQADRAHANFVIPAFDVTQDGHSEQANVIVDSGGAAHFVWSDDVEGGPLTRTRGRDGTLGPVQPLAADGEDTELAADGAGNVQFTWRSSDGKNLRVRTRRLSADGTLGETVDLSAANYNASSPQIAIDDAGGGVFAWTRSTVGGNIIQAQRLEPDGTLGPMENISAAGHVHARSVAVDDRGQAIVVWARFDGSHNVAQMRAWNPDGSLGEIKDLTMPGANAENLDVAFDGSGDAHFVVQRGSAVLAGRIDAGGLIAPLQDLREAPGDTASAPSLAVDATGNAQVVWRAVALKGGKLIQTRHEYPDGSWGPVQNLWPWSDGLPRPLVAFDGLGNAHHVWNSGGMAGIVMGRAVGNDGSLGQIQQLSGTTLGYEGADAHGVALAASPKGEPVAAWSHARTDLPQARVQGAAVGLPTADAGGGSGEASSGDASGGAPDRLAPVLSGLALRPAKLVVRGRGRLTYSLSEPAKVVLRVIRRGTGRNVGTVRASGRAGRNSLSFRSRLRGRWLKPSRYVFVAVATDAAGNRSAPRRARFRVVKRAR